MIRHVIRKLNFFIYSPFVHLKLDSGRADTLGLAYLTDSIQDYTLLSVYKKPLYRAGFVKS